jgi:AraC-like DNA-binding protein/quercetin dioxygenase-like cupin family protein
METISDEYGKKWNGQFAWPTFVERTRTLVEMIFSGHSASAYFLRRLGILRCWYGLLSMVRLLSRDRFWRCAMHAKANWGTLGLPLADAPPGRLLRLAHTPAATVRHAVYEAGAIVPRHRHARASLVYGVGGPCFDAGLQRTDQGRGVVKRRLTFHPAGYEHSVSFGGSCHVLAIEFDDNRFPAGPGLSWPLTSTVLPATLYDHVWWAMLRIADDQPNETVAEALAGLIGDAAQFVARRKPEWLLELVEHIHGHWQDIQSVNALAESFRMSPQHMCRAFKSHLGVTIGQYSLLLRLDHARGLLWGTGRSISDIAADTGFSDQSHLTRTLALHSERTPARLRGKGSHMRDGVAVSEIR